MSVESAQHHSGYIIRVRLGFSMNRLSYQNVAACYSEITL